MYIAYSRIRTMMLSFVGGYVDTLGFIALFGLFTAHITGNFVLIGSMLVHPASGVLLKFVVFPSFMLSVAITRVVILYFDKRDRSPLKLLYGAEMLLLISFMVVGLMGRPILSDTDMAPILAGISAAFAMGVQNAISSSTLLMPTVSTTVMTGNVTTLIIGLVDIFNSKNQALKDQARGRVRELYPAVMLFFVGAICAGLGFQYLSFWALCLPIAILAWLAIDS